MGSIAEKAIGQPKLPSPLNLVEKTSWNRSRCISWNEKVLGNVFG